MNGQLRSFITTTLRKSRAMAMKDESSTYASTKHTGTLLVTSEYVRKNKVVLIERARLRGQIIPVSDGSRVKDGATATTANTHIISIIVLNSFCCSVSKGKTSRRTHTPHTFVKTCVHSPSFVGSFSSLGSSDAPKLGASCSPALCSPALPSNAGIAAPAWYCMEVCVAARKHNNKCAQSGYREENGAEGWRAATPVFCRLRS